MRKTANKKKGKNDSDKTLSNENENGDTQLTETESDADKKSKSKKKGTHEMSPEEPADSALDKKRKPALKGGSTDESEPDEEYEVDSIVGTKLTKGKRQFKIRWKGYGEDSDTWEFEDNLKCPDMIEAYLKENPDETSNKPQKRSKPLKEKDTKAKKKKTSDQSEDSIDEGESEEKTYEVQKIMEVRFKKNGKKEFLVHWKGFQHKYDSWEPEEHLSCPELIKDILAKAEKAKDIPARELRADPKQTKRLTLAMQQHGRRLSRRHQGKERASYSTSYAS